MSNSELLERINYFTHKQVWKYSDMEDCEKFRQQLKFDIVADLNYVVMDFFYGGMLSRIISDARERSERLGEYEGYTWGKRYLENYVGTGCLVSKAEYPALHTSEAYDLVLDKLIAECRKGDEKYERRMKSSKRKNNRKAS